MWKEIEESTRGLRAHRRALFIVLGITLLLVILSTMAHAEPITLNYGECQDYLNAINETVTVCAPAFPAINETVNLDYGGSYENQPYILTVTAPPLNNCTIVQNVTYIENVTYIQNVTYVQNITWVQNTTVMNVTNVSACVKLNKTVNLTFSEYYYDDARNTTVKAPDSNTCPELRYYDVNLGFNQSGTWEYVKSITVHGPSEGNCTNANVSVSRMLNFGEIFSVNQPGCFVELFAPPLQNLSCPMCPTCPSLPIQTCPTCPRCPENTVTKEVKIDTCPRPSSNNNCTMSIQIDGKMYCKDSLDTWYDFGVNQSVFSCQNDLQSCLGQTVAKDATIAYIKSNSELVNTVLLIVLVLGVSVIIKIFWDKLNRGSGPVASRIQEKLVEIVKSPDIPQNLLPKQEKSQIEKKKPAKASKKR